jgi:hypothetical protein
MCRVTRSSGDSPPAATSAPHTADVTDFETDISRWVVSGVIALRYCSWTIRPRWRTRNASV